jgi:DNA-binding transcriptional ArsR family regulator
MEDFYTIQTVEQVKALTDPLRKQILGAFCQGPMTTKQVAEQLGEKPTRLYYHVTILEQAGLIEIVETRQIRGTVEKTYRAVATKFRVDRDLFKVAPESETGSSGVLVIINTLEEALAHFQDESAQAVLGTQIAEEQLVFVHAQNLCLTPSQVSDLKTRICELLEECAGECKAAANGEGPSYTFTLVLYPVLSVDGKAN